MMVQMKKVLFHIAVICGLVCAVAKILDWYNPYMDFEGHTVVLHYLLYFGALGLGISRIFRQRGRQRHAEQ